MQDTIFAIASARGRAGVAVVRVSGPDAMRAGEAICGTLPQHREAALRVLRDPGTGDEIDSALVVAFPAGASYTGEKIVEFQIHGSVAVQAGLLRVLALQPGLRLAEPGEFTRRALENGRLDLAQAEGLADLIDAETEAQRRQALRVTRGALGRLAERWRAGLLRAAAVLEATIDFADEDLPGDMADEVRGVIDGLIPELAAEVRGAAAAERIRDGYEVAIIGRPNVGKSTLLNALAGRDAAITSETAGTTRDVIEVRMDVRGLPVTLIDTAGLREARDAIEAVGIARARERAEAADLRVFLLGPGEDTAGMEVAAQPGDILAGAKGDLAKAERDLAVSGLTGAGLGALLDRVAGELETRAAGASTVIRLRQRQAIERAISSLESARAHIMSGEDSADLAAEELRAALRQLDVLIGRVDVETLLDEIFSSFCLGK